jgi:hypothetical protein
LKAGLAMQFGKKVLARTFLAPLALTLFIFFATPGFAALWSAAGPGQLLQPFGPYFELFVF